jgi:hypothetical protein
MFLLILVLRSCHKHHDTHFMSLFVLLWQLSTTLSYVMFPSRTQRWSFACFLRIYGVS